jgi:hypothetical protein
MSSRKPKGYWTEKKCLELGRKHESRAAFKKASASAYNAACKGGFLDKVCSHMELGCKPPGYWTKERCLKEAAKYKTVGELEKHAPHILNKIRKNKWNHDPSYKMEMSGNRYYRCLYAFEFEDGRVYVGLSFNPDIRRKEHLRRKDSPVYKHLKVCDAKFVVYPEWFHKNEIGKKEAELILKHEEEGWTLLNSATAGALGSGRIQWTKVKIREELDRAGSLKKFGELYKGGCSLIYKNNWHDVICPEHRTHMPRGFWTKEKCKAEAKKYDSRKEFMDGSPAAHDYARRMDWFDVICDHMEYLNKPNNYWTKERCIEALKKITTLEQLNKETALKSVLYYHGWMEELAKHIPRIKKPNGYWAKERCAQEAKKYNTRSEFKRGSGAAYSAAVKMKYLDDICVHMESSRTKK